jgi:hypothetical protein
MSRLSKWVSTGGAIAVKDMEFFHLINTLRLVRGYAKDRDNGRNNKGFDSIINGRAIHEWVADFQREIDRRNNVRYTGRTR